MRKLALKIEDHGEAEVCAAGACGADELQGGPRIRGPLPAKVKGSDALGARFRSAAVLENLSAGDFQLRLNERVEAGERIFVATRISNAVVVLRGTVTPRRPGEAPGGVSVRITRYRFVYRHPESD